MSRQSLTKKVNLQKLPNSGKALDIKADRVTLETLAELTDADEVSRFEAELLVKPWKANGVSVTGKISAGIRQTCVVSLEAMENALEFGFTRYFLPVGDPAFGNQVFEDGELVVDPEADDLPDLLENSSVDVWEVLIEELNLRIDPFPKLQNLEFANGPEGSVSPETRKPFSGLKALITEKKSRKR